MSYAANAAPRFETQRARALLLKSSFYRFVIKVFETLHPATAFVPEWHIEVIGREAMDFLSNVSDRHLVVNQPPRSLKSITLSVALPAYLLGKNPSARIMCVSYNGPLANQMARDTLAVMTAPGTGSCFRELSLLAIPRKASSPRGTAIGAPHPSTVP